MIYHHKLSNQLVTLRNIKPTDELASYLCWLSDHAVNQFLEIRLNLPGNITDLRKYVNMINKSSDSILFGIFSKNGDLTNRYEIKPYTTPSSRPKKRFKAE